MELSSVDLLRLGVHEGEKSAATISAVTVGRLWTVMGSGPHQDGDPSDIYVINKDSSTQKRLYCGRLFVSIVHAKFHHWYHQDYPLSQTIDWKYGNRSCKTAGWG